MRFRILAAASLFLFSVGCDCAGPSTGDDGGPDGSSLDAAFTDAQPGDGGPPTDAGQGPMCEGTACHPGQRCDLSAEPPACVDNRCEDLSCSTTERCQAHSLGGVSCVSIACTSDVQCATEEHCDGTICQADVCVAGTLRCEGSDQVMQCRSNGGGEQLVSACGSPSAFESTCVEGGPSTTGCTCEGDWDCPAYTACEAGICTGRGVAPTCTLPPTPFAETPPAVELEWGGVSRDDDDAHDGTVDGSLAPWPAFSHVLNTPIVANLDDDNGDGLINELDFPEILFVTHQGNNPWVNGVLRAIHGGGPRKGADFFARCADLLWQEGDGTPAGCTSATSPDADSGAPVAVGDLDGDGRPEIVYLGDGNRFRILSASGEQLYHLPGAQTWDGAGSGDTPSLADLDHDGMVEIIVGRTVYKLAVDAAGVWSLTHRLDGGASSGRNGGVSQMTCAADVRSDLPGQEFVAGGTLYRLPDTLPTCGTPPCTGALEEVWNSGHHGFCAIADVWGADPDSSPGPDNRPDGQPEIVLIDDGTLVILNSQDGTTILDQHLGGGGRGGAPNVDDFDGDGFMEVASALENFYVVIDLQESTGAAGSCPSWPAVIDRATSPGDNSNPARTPGGSCASDAECDPAAACNLQLGACVCLHNGWRRDSDDDSSRATSSSVFDFNGDGAAEVLYNDECDFRVYDGLSGAVLFSAMSRSRTGIENPVVADVDNDGNAEVVTVSNTAQGGRCDEDGASPRGPNGIRVWGDPTDTWVSARRIWNQQSYHVVNVSESGSIPATAPPSWGQFNGRSYNTYRSQPRSHGVAPDLMVADIGLSSPEAVCGALSDTVDITVEVRNQGDLRVGPGVSVAFIGIWGTEEEPLLDAAGDPLTYVLTASLEPGRSIFLSLNYDRAHGTRGLLPDRIRVVVDPADATHPDGLARECLEDNNTLEAEVAAGAARPDLLVEVGDPVADCSALEVALPVVVINQGTATASPLQLSVYAGDPALGGTLLHTQTLAAPLAAGDSRSLTLTISDFPTDRQIRLFVSVDPTDLVDECNNANNTAAASADVACFTGPF